MNNIALVCSLLTSLVAVDDYYLYENVYFGNKEFYEVIGSNSDSSYFQNGGDYYKIGYERYVVNPNYSYNRYYTSIIKIPLINISDESVLESSFQLFLKSGNISCVGVSYTLENIDYSLNQLPTLTFDSYSYVSDGKLTIETTEIVKNALSHSKKFVTLVLSMSMYGGYGEFYKLSSTNQYSPVFTISTSQNPTNINSLGTYYQIKNNGSSDPELHLNCASYALKNYSHIIDDLLGDFSGVNYQYDINSFKKDILMYSINGFINDYSKALRILENYNSPLYDDEWRIACCLSVKNDLINDMHFMVQTNDGRWAEKKIEQPSKIYEFNENPDTIDWGTYFQEDIIYFAVSD